MQSHLLASVFCSMLLKLQPPSQVLHKLIDILVLSRNRPRPFVGSRGSACRSRSSHQVVYCSDSFHSDPLYRKTVRALHPVEATGMVAAQSCSGRRGPATRYVIVNEHEPRRKLLRSTTRIPRHYLMGEPAEILELYPRSTRRYASRAAVLHQHPHRSHTSQHLPAADSDKDGPVLDTRRASLGKTHRPRSLSDLQPHAHFYIGDHSDPIVHVRCEARREDDDKGGINWADPDPPSPTQSGVRAAEPLVVRTRHCIHSPGRPGQSTSRTRHTEPYIKRKSRPKLEVPLTESDSASVASSSDQQNSSTDQYIQVIHNKERHLRSEGSRQDKAAKTKSRTSFQSSDLVCSNV